MSKAIGIVGDPDEPLGVATMVAALTKLRISGATGPFVLRLHPDQCNDVEAAIVAGPGNSMLFRGVSIRCSSDHEGDALCTESGHAVTVVSSKRRNGRDRESDARAPAEQVAALKAECERNRLAHRPEAEALRDRVAELEANIDSLRDVRDGLACHMRAAPRWVLDHHAGDGPVQGNPYLAIRYTIEAIDRVFKGRRS